METIQVYCLLRIEERSHILLYSILQEVWPFPRFLLELMEGSVGCSAFQACKNKVPDNGEQGIIK